ncbi:complement factor H-like isoform 5-T5 [Mergus octosetaceus]
MTLLSLMTGFLLWMCCATHKASAGAACEDPPLIEFGKIVSGVKSEYEENDRVQYTCNPGYALSGSERVTCHGKVWMPGPPQCLERPCGSIPAVANAAFEGRSKEKYEPGETVRYQCHEGFQITGPPEIFCRRGNWSTPPICEDVRCGAPPEILNAHITSTQQHRYLPGAKVHYECESNSQIMGVNYVTCSDGHWTKVPSCRDVTCEPPPEIAGGKVQGVKKPRYLPGEIAHYQCWQGFQMTGASTVTCQNGTWTERPQCKEILCSPPRVPNGNFRPQEDSYREGAVITIDCNPGYRLRTLSGKNTAQCTSRGWVPAPDCVEKPCDYPVIENGKISERMAHFYFPMRIGQYVDYHCRNGYLAPNGERVVRIFCSKGGWNPEPKCLKTCSVTHLENGYFRYNRYTYTEGERIQYVCNQDYRTESEGGEVTCTKNGWSPFPRCIRKMVCTASEEDMDRNNIELRWRGERKLYSTSGDFVEFDCKIGYVQDPASSPFRVQCMDGTLEYPRCKPGRNCSLSETAMERNNIKLRHSRRRSDIYRSKETISFTCYFLFREVSNPEDFDAQCQDGVINYPRCERTFG